MNALKRLLAAAAVVLAVLVPIVPVAAAPKIDPSFEMSPGPYHYGGTVTVMTHGDYNVAKARIRMLCFQDGDAVYGEAYEDPLPDEPYVFHFGQWGLSQWDLNGGGAADCDIRFDEARPPYRNFGQLFFHVEA